jgi:hypothetical protein
MIYALILLAIIALTSGIIYQMSRGFAEPIRVERIDCTRSDGSPHE